jgi:KDO2-lipid IV(A) lauroyltransferase
MTLKLKLRNLRYLLESLFVKIGIWIFSAMDGQKASDVAATIAKFVGKKISVHKLAYKNLSNAIPGLTENEKEKILDDMWDNLGRIVGEYPHIWHSSIDEVGSFIETSQESLKNIEDLKKTSKGGIIFSGHIGNWEIGLKSFLKNGLNISTVYRPFNNPYVEKIVASIRGDSMIAKSSSGNRKIIEAIKEKKFVVMMADQRVSEGEPVQFFHDLATTATSIARIALKYDVPLIPARSIRLGTNFKFRFEVEKPLAIHKSSDINSDVLQLTRQVNLKLESWIRQYPAQWFWVHNRWKK